MIFSTELLELIKKVYPMCPDYTHMAESGDEQLISALNSMCDDDITPDEVVAALEKGEEGRRNLYNKAIRLKDRQAVYFKAMEEYEQYTDEESKDRGREEPATN